jgi:hypothetical protein
LGTTASVHAVGLAVVDIATSAVPISLFEKVRAELAQETLGEAIDTPAQTAQTAHVSQRTTTTKTATRAKVTHATTYAESA